MDKIKIPAVGVLSESSIRELIEMYMNNKNEESFHNLHPCPLQVDDMRVYNYSSNRKLDFEKLQPDGDYRYVHKFWNDDDENIFTATIYERFKTGEVSFI